MSATPMIQATRGALPSHGSLAVPYPSARRATHAFLIFALAALLANFDRQFIVLLVEPLRRDLHLSDMQIGLLTGPAFALFYAAAGLPLGWLADRAHRRNLLILGVLGWTLATAASAFAGQFATLLVCRVLVGIGEGVLVPTVFSMLGDYFAPRRRAAAFGWFTAVVVVSSSVAMSLGGVALRVLDATDAMPFGIDAGWRMAFLCAAVPGPVVALALLSVQEPPRHTGESGVTAGGDFFRTHWRTLALLVLGLASASGAFQLTLAWFPTVLVRAHGWTASQAGEVLGLVLGSCAAAAAYAAARLSRRAEGRGGPAHLQRITAIMIPAASVLVLAWLQPYPQWALLAVAGVLAPVLIAYSLSALLLQTATPNHSWGRIAAGFKLTESVTVALGAPVVGVLSDRIFVTQDGIGAALALSVACVLLGSGAALAACRKRYAALLQIVSAGKS